jgi:membrane protein YqaA with SNARE-associated domain
VLTTVLIVIVTLWLWRDAISDIGFVGYPGVFFVSLLSSGGFIFPVPGVVAACSLGVVLIPALVGLLNALGETVGELTGYGVGYGTRGAIERRRFYIKAKGWMDRRGTLVVFVLSVLPNPIFDFVGIAAGSTRYPLRQFIATVFAGKIIKGLVVSYTCSVLSWDTLLPWVN